MNDCSERRSGDDSANVVREAAETSVPARFERIVELHRSRMALGAGVWQPTYEELNVVANRLAHALIARGGRPGDRIAVLMQPDTPLFAASLAVIKSGRIVVVFNPTDPAARLRQLMEDAEPSLIIADPANWNLAADIAGPKCGTVSFESDSAAGTGTQSVNQDRGRSNSRTALHFGYHGPAEGCDDDAPSDSACLGRRRHNSEIWRPGQDSSARTVEPWRRVHRLVACPFERGNALSISDRTKGDYRPRRVDDRARHDRLHVVGFDLSERDEFDRR